MQKPGSGLLSNCALILELKAKEVTLERQSHALDVACAAKNCRETRHAKGPTRKRWSALRRVWHRQVAGGHCDCCDTGIKLDGKLDA